MIYHYKNVGGAVYHMYKRLHPLYAQKPLKDITKAIEENIWG